MALAALSDARSALRIATSDNAHAMAAQPMTIMALSSGSCTVTVFRFSGLASTPHTHDPSSCASLSCLSSEGLYLTSTTHLCQGEAPLSAPGLRTMQKRSSCAGSARQGLFLPQSSSL